MTTRRALMRSPLLTLLLAAQLFGAAVPLADAWLELAAAGPVEVGAPSEGSSGPVHVDGACVLCQHLDQHRAAAHAVPTVDAPRIARAPVQLWSTRSPAPAAPLLERGRSPPVA